MYHLKPLGTFILLLLFGILAAEKAALQKDVVNPNARNRRMVPEAPNRKRLNGILFLNDHFGSKIGPGRYSGFSAEVLDQISQLTTLDFNLTDIPFEEGRLIPHIDFWMGPLSDISPHPKFSFSEPLFADDNLVAVVSRKHAKSLRLCRVHNLFPNTTEPRSNTTEPRSNTTEPPLEIWSLQGVNHLLELERHKPCPEHEQLLRRFPDYIWEHMNLSRNYIDSMSQVLRGKIALLTSLRRAQKMIEGFACEQFVILRDQHKLAPRNVVIYLRKGSPFLEELNEAIRKLKKMGIMQKLVSKNWPDARGDCPELEYCDFSTERPLPCNPKRLLK